MIATNVKLAEHVLTVEKMREKSISYKHRCIYVPNPDWWSDEKTLPSNTVGLSLFSEKIDISTINSDIELSAMFRRSDILTYILHLITFNDDTIYLGKYTKLFPNTWLFKPTPSARCI